MRTRPPPTPLTWPFFLRQQDESASLLTHDDCWQFNLFFSEVLTQLLTIFRVTANLAAVALRLLPGVLAWEITVRLNSSEWLLSLPIFLNSKVDQTKTLKEHHFRKRAKTNRYCVLPVCVYDRTALHAGAVFFFTSSRVFVHGSSSARSAGIPEAKWVHACILYIGTPIRDHGLLLEHGLLLKNSEHRVVPY